MNLGDFTFDGLSMGLEHPLVVESFDPPVLDWTAGDVVDAWGRRHFGRDYAVGGTASLTIATNTDTADEARAAYGDLARRWGRTRATGERVELAYRLGDEERVLYGRPRKLAPVVDGVDDTGRMVAVGEFVLEAPFSYGRAWRSASVGMIPEATGGFTAAFTAPIITEGMGEVTGAIPDVGGDVPAPVHVQIKGPIVNPVVSGDGWRMALSYSVADGETVNVHTDTFEAYSSRGNSIAGALSLSTRLANVRLRPGPDYFRLEGTDPSGRASATLRWRPAYLGV